MGIFLVACSGSRSAQEMSDAAAPPMTAGPLAQQFTNQPSQALIDRATAEHVLTDDELKLVAVYWAGLVVAADDGSVPEEFIEGDLSGIVAALALQYPSFFKGSAGGGITLALISAVNDVPPTSGCGSCYTPELRFALATTLLGCASARSGLKELGNVKKAGDAVKKARGYWNLFTQTYKTGKLEKVGEAGLTIGGIYKGVATEAAKGLSAKDAVDLIRSLVDWGLIAAWAAAPFAGPEAVAAVAVISAGVAVAECSMDLLSSAAESYDKCKASRPICADASVPATDAGALLALAGGGFGDPHMYTFDGVLYDFQRVGEFVLARDDGGLEVQVRLAPYAGSKSIATTIGLAANVNGDRVEVDAAGKSPARLLVNGTASMGGSLPRGGTARLSTITWPDGTTLDVRHWGDRIDVQLRRAGSLPSSGLLGNGNGRPNDDFALKDGTILARPIDGPGWAAFTQAWRITNDESLFLYGPGQDTSTFTDLAFPYASATASGLPAADYAAARATCLKQGITDEALLEACILDVASTKDDSYATGASAISGVQISGDPAILATSVDSQSLLVDKLGTFTLPPDGVNDGAFDVTVRGPIVGLVLLSYGQWNTSMSQPVPPEIPANHSFAGRYLLRVDENGQTLNNPDGSLQPIDERVHHLTVYTANGGSSPASAYSGAHFRFYALLANGHGIQGPEIVY
jgi:hypothetical protein